MEALPIPQIGTLWVAAAPRAYLREAASVLIARTVLAYGQVRVLDGGNVFNLQRISRELRMHDANLEDQLKRIQINRAFTFYQVLSLLADTPADPVPTIFLEPLATFTDETASLAERKRLLRQSITHLRRLSRRGPVAVTVSTEQADEPDEWLAMLIGRADLYLPLRFPPSPRQPGLF